MARKVALALLILCSSCAFSSQDELPNGYNNVKLLQKLPEKIIASAAKKQSESIMSYIIDFKSGEETMYGGKLSNVWYQTADDGVVVGIILGFSLTDSTPDEILSNMIKKFGNPKRLCNSMIGSSNAYIASEAYRWQQNERILQLVLGETSGNKKFLSVTLRTDKYSTFVDEKNNTDCKEMSAPVESDKLWKSMKPKNY